jgi:quercetin dioxygenase-like cupin family protein
MTHTTTEAKVVRWNDLPQDRPMEMLARRRIVGEKAMLSEIQLEKGCVVPTHAHENEQIACVVSGKMRFGIGAESSPDRHEVVVEAGGVLVLPSNVPHSAEALEDSLVLDVFSPVSETTGIDRGH